MPCAQGGTRLPRRGGVVHSPIGTMHRRAWQVPVVWGSPEAKYIDVKSAGFFSPPAGMAIWTWSMERIFIYGSTRYPAFFHASKPPSRAPTFVYPLCKRRNAARALECSLSQVQ
ncbi:MAG: hypothetical protein MZV64_58915 [Ignavibacteriales bacterium]|nr:hypothetical protein [Ignavibacteriales bacterium]